MIGFSDSDYADHVNDKKSTFGYIFMMAEGAFSWKSVNKKLRASSTMEAEYVTYYETIFLSIWLRNFISALEVVHSISKPLKLFHDNSATVYFSRNTKSTSRSKHIDVNLYFFKEKVIKSSFQLSTCLQLVCWQTH